MTTSDSEGGRRAPEPISQKPFIPILLVVWMVLTALFFFIRFSYVFFLSYRDVIVALFRQFFDS